MALAVYDRGELPGRAWIELMAPAIELSKAIAGTDFVPKGLRNNPAAICAAILYGDEVGIGPMQALAKIAVIDGRPALAAEAQRALILRAGHELWIEEYSVTAVTIAGRRNGSETSNRVTWTMDDARRANLAGKPSWRAYPRQMLLARASAELARATFADVIGGLAALEEIEAPDNAVPADAPELERVATPETSTGTRRRRRSPSATVSSPPPELAENPVPGEPNQPTMSTAQRRKLMAAYNQLGLNGTQHRDERLAHASAILGHQITSANDLTADEANTVINAVIEQLETPFETGTGVTDPDAGEPPSHAPPASTAAPSDPADTLDLEPPEN